MLKVGAASGTSNVVFFKKKKKNLTIHFHLSIPHKAAGTFLGCCYLPTMSSTPRSTLPLPYRRRVYVTTNLTLYVVLHLSPITTLFLRRIHSSHTHELLFMLGYAPRGGRAAAKSERCGRRSSTVPSRNEKMQDEKQ